MRFTDLKLVIKINTLRFDSFLYGDDLQIDSHFTHLNNVKNLVNFTIFSLFRKYHYRLEINSY